MCGIAGIVDFRRLAEEQPVLAMCRAMEHRGPDDGGTFVSEDCRCVLGNRRLAIIDLTQSGHMPLQSADGRFCITYNGELYNFTEHRAALERRGRRFRSHTDTEVALALYQEFGPSCVEVMNGMFAFAIWDSAEKTLFLARDRMGIKPLYYHAANGRLVFASEIRALLASELVERRADPEAIAGFLTLGSVPDSHTILEGVRALPPGSYALIVEDGKVEVQSYWSHADQLRCTPAIGTHEMPDAVREAVKDAVKRQMVADVPLGLFLSGGVDSSMLAATARASGQEHIRSVSISFEEQRFDESANAREVARRFGLDHAEVSVTAEDVRSALPGCIGAMDQPSIDGVNTYFVSRSARQAGLTVALSGLGADELFGGYATFSAIPRLIGVLRGLQRVPQLEAGRGMLPKVPGVPHRVRKLAAWAQSPATVVGAYAAMRGLLAPPDVMALTGACPSFDPYTYLDSIMDLHGIEEHCAVSLLEARVYMHNQLLRDTDAMSMAHSLEVRVPYLDATVVTVAAQCAAALGDGAKRALVEARSLYFPVGEDRGPKQGFTFPFEHWLAGPLGQELRVQGEGDQFLPTGTVSDLWTGFLQGRRHWSAVWAVVVLQAWMRLHRLSVG